MAVLLAALLGGAGGSLLGTCGPFTDVAGDAFCPFVLEIFYMGITTGTTPTTYDPASAVNRLQMAAFLSRTVDGVVKRGSRRAAFNQNWTSQNSSVLAVTTVGSSPRLLQSDGLDLWVAGYESGTVSRVRSSDGRLLETWTAATNAFGVLVAMGKVLVSGASGPGELFLIDPRQPAGAVTTVASTLGSLPTGIGFDGARVWTANDGSISIVTPAVAVPWTVTTITAGFNDSVRGVVHDGSNIWVTISNPGRLLKLDGAGAILQTVTVGGSPQFPVFDGTNIWVPNFGSSALSVIRASSGALLQQLTGNGLFYSISAAFDGERVLVTNNFASYPSVSLWKAANLSPLGSFVVGDLPLGACSDRLNFWITLQFDNKLLRF